MKNKIAVAIATLTLPYFGIAQNQEKTKVKEAGIIFSDLNNFGLTYRAGNTRSVWRFNSLFGSGASEESISAFSENTTESNYANFGLKIGKEFRKDISENFQFRYGADLSFIYRHSEYSNNRLDGYMNKNVSTTYSPGINFVLGFNYSLKENLILGLELLPDFAYETGRITREFAYPHEEIEKTERDVSGFNYGISNNSALLSLIYRF